MGASSFVRSCKFRDLGFCEKRQAFGQLKRVPRTENNPHGLLIVNWRTLLNKDIEQKTKSNY